MSRSILPARLRSLNDASRHSEPATGHLDEIRFHDALIRNVDPENSRRIPAGCSLYVRGWAFTGAPYQPASKVFLLIGPDIAFPVRYGDARWDIVPHYDDPRLEPVGFRGIFPLTGLDRGSYDICVAAFVPGTNEYHLLETGERFEIVESQHLFPGKRVAAKGIIQTSIDTIQTATGRQPNRRSLNVQQRDTVMIRGWGVDHERASAISGAFACIDGKEYICGVHGLPRYDVAQALGIPEARRCGFTIHVPISGLTRGSHTLEVVALAEDGVSYSVSDGCKLIVC